MDALPPHMGGITVPDLPQGYLFRATRYADLILRDAFPRHFEELVAALETFRIPLKELQEGGGNRTPFVARFDASLQDRGWGKRNFDIETTIDEEPVAKVRSHEIDMFKPGSAEEPYPGIAIEMEWNNKDPFFDRDLTNFYALHRAGALAVGIIVTRGLQLQGVLKRTVRNKKGEEKYGESSTHWTKLMARVDLGGGGECPLLLVGIEGQRIEGIEKAEAVARQLEAADVLLKTYRERGISYREAQAERREAVAKARELLPPPTRDEEEGEEG